MSKLLATSILGLLWLGCTDELYSPNSDTLNRLPDTRPIGLATPGITIGIGIETGTGTLQWHRVADATQYTIERDMLPTFPAPNRLYCGVRFSYDLGEGSGYPWTYYYRVRAENSVYVSNWSNTIAFP